MTLVSVIIPVRNGEAYVADAVASALAQTDVPVDVIVIDDGSTDGTPEALAGFAGRITLHRQEGRGLSASRNAGMAFAQGELFVFLDADDLLPPHYLARFAAAAAAAPHAGVFHCGWQGVDYSDGRILYGRDTPFDLDADPFHTIAAEGSPPINALAVRREAAALAGPFDEREDDHEDLDYWLGLAASGATFQGVPGNVALIRRRIDSWSALAGTRGAVSGLAVLERHLARHQRCPACVESDRGLQSWRRAVLLLSAQDFARRLHLGGRTGRWIGTGLAVARRPRLAPTAWLALRQRLPRR